MSYLLDTNTCIYFLNQCSENLTRRLKTANPRELAVCAIVKAELHYGALKSARPAQNLAIQRDFLRRFRSFPFNDQAAKVYGQIRADLERIGTPIGPNDLCIAAIALANDLTLITHNIGEFSRVKELKFEDWRI
jgi:tRNA(fMet)-specific endonuclease VapC